MPISRLPNVLISSLGSVPSSSALGSIQCDTTLLLIKRLLPLYSSCFQTTLVDQASTKPRSHLRIGPSCLTSTSNLGPLLHLQLIVFVESSGTAKSSRHAMGGWGIMTLVSIFSSTMNQSLTPISLAVSNIEGIIQLILILVQLLARATMGQAQGNPWASVLRARRRLAYFTGCNLRVRQRPTHTSVLYIYFNTGFIGFNMLSPCLRV
jgi:hypothetical protein